MILSLMLQVVMQVLDTSVEVVQLPGDVRSVTGDSSSQAASVAFQECPDAAEVDAAGFKGQYVWRGTEFSRGGGIGGGAGST